jgi:hypothetical protein
MNIIDKHFNQMVVDINEQINREYSGCVFSNPDMGGQVRKRVMDILTKGMNPSRSTLVKRYINVDLSWDARYPNHVEVRLHYGDKLYCRCHEKMRDIV